jgi:hypothetical protein
MDVKVAAQSATLAKKPFVERLNAINFQSLVKRECLIYIRIRNFILDEVFFFFLRNFSEG